MAQQTATVEPPAPSGGTSGGTRIRTSGRVRATRAGGRFSTYTVLWLGSFLYALSLIHI